jgi:Protein of unknown function (DUF2442)
MIKVKNVSPLDGYRLNLSFSDGTAGIFDLAPSLAKAGPMVEPLKDSKFFARVFLENGAPTWPNGYDLAPWALHKELEDAQLLKPASASAAE